MDEFSVARAAIPQLGPAEVHVWRADVAAFAPREAQIAMILDGAERARAGRFHFARDRLQYVVAHAILRLLLAAYTGRPAAALEFSVGPAGKPTLRTSDGSPRPEFNLSHSGNVVLVAVTRDAPVGIDVEQHSPDVECEALIEHFFSPAECAEFWSLGSKLQRAAFFACWSRKEAYIKATGLGVSAGLDYFDVTVAPDRPPRILADRRGSAEPSPRWAIADINVGRSYSGALVVADALQTTAPTLLAAEIDATGFLRPVRWQAQNVPSHRIS